MSASMITSDLKSTQTASGVRLVTHGNRLSHVSAIAESTESCDLLQLQAGSKPSRSNTTHRQLCQDTYMSIVNEPPQFERSVFIHRNIH